MNDNVHRVPSEENVGHETLVARARFLGVNEGEYLSGLPRNRHAYRMEYLRRLRQTARDMQIDEEEFVAERMADWPEEKSRVVGEDDPTEVQTPRVAGQRNNPSLEMSRVVDEEDDDLRDNEISSVADENEDASDVDEDEARLEDVGGHREASRDAFKDWDEEEAEQEMEIVRRHQEAAVGGTGGATGDDLLRQQARFLGIDEDNYIRDDVKTRTLRRAHFVRGLRRAARESGQDEDAVVATRMAAFPEAPLTPHQLKQKEYRQTFLERQARGETKKRGQSTEESRVQAATPATETKKRGQSTEESRVQSAKSATGLDVGEPRVQAATPATPTASSPPEKLSAARTLTDLYATYPISEDTENYYLRVERTYPKKYQGFDVAGYVGNVRGYIEEKDFQLRFGGSEYLVTPYGPDPRRKDGNGDPTIRALGSPIKIVVPVYPPNLDVADESPMQMNSMNPFGARPINQHDAAIHKTNTEFQRDLLTQQQQETARKEKEQQVVQGSIFHLFADSQKQNVEVLRDAAAARERALERQLQTEQEARKALEEKVSKVSEAFTARTGQNFDFDSIQKLLLTVGPNREAESQRVAENYRVQLETLKNSHEEALKQLRDRHVDEIRRNEDRYKDNDTFYKRQLEEERTKSNDRERQLRDEIDKIRRDERDLAKQRMEEVKDRYEGEIKNLEKSHDREMRSLRESFDTKLTVTKETSEMRLHSVEERARDALEEAERARIEAKEASDPVHVMARARETAEALGFEKRDDAPKTAFERFATTAGMGLSQALSSIHEWGPQMMQQRAAAAAQAAQAQVPQLPAGGGSPQLRARPLQQQGAAPRPPQGQPIARRERVQQWAKPRAVPVTPDEPLGFVTPEAPPAQPEATSMPPEPRMQSMPPEPRMLQPEETNVQDAPRLPEKFTQHFHQDMIFGFLSQAEQSINALMDADMFADQFHLIYPAEAKKMITHFKPTDIVEAVRGVPGADASPLLRRDGQAWLVSLWAALETRQR